MKPHRLTRSCLTHTPGTSRRRPPAISSSSSSSSTQPYLPFLYPSHARSLTSSFSSTAPSNKSATTTTTTTTSLSDPWSFLLGRPDPSAPRPPIFNHFRAPPSPPRFSFKPPSAYFPTPLSPYQQHLHPPSTNASPHLHNHPSIYPLDPTYSTITERERAIFSIIFESILSESPSPSNLSSPLSSSSTTTTRPSPALTALFESAVGPQFSRDKISFGPTTASSKASFLSAAMARASAITDLPPSLRFAAAHAGGLPGIPLTESDYKQEAARQSQLLELLSKLDSCETDAEVLTFLDTHVFSMITSPESHSTETLDIKGRKFVFPSASYADLLAHALHLLLRTFRDLPSTLYVFQRIKSLGPESYVIGCNINVYNLILTAQWDAYRSINIISGTLDEMRINGIEGDNETVEVLRAVCLNALGDWRVGGLGGLGDREKVVLGKVNSAIGQIKRSIKEREMEARGEKTKARAVREGSAGLGMVLGLEGRKGRK